MKTFFFSSDKEGSPAWWLATSKAASCAVAPEATPACILMLYRETVLRQIVRQYGLILRCQLAAVVEPCGRFTSAQKLRALRSRTPPCDSR